MNWYRGKCLQSKPFENTLMFVMLCYWKKIVVQLSHMSQPVGFGLSRPARAARTPFFPYCSQMHGEDAVLHKGKLHCKGTARGGGTR